MPPGGNGQITTVTQLTSALISQFESAVGAQQQARTAVESTASALMWSGQAAAAYRTALSEWVRGLEQVRKGLMDLQGAMQSHAATTTTTEDDNLQSVNVTAQEIAVASWT